MTTFWVSFATEEGFLGVAIVDVASEDPDTTVSEVIKRSIELGVNPGESSVQVQRLPSGEIPERFKNRLLTRAEVDHLNSGGLLN